MKKLNRNIATIAVSLLTFFYVGFCLSEVLTVPYRGASSMQTSSTVIEFEPLSFGANPTITVAGQSVAVADSTCTGLSCVNTAVTAAGDDIQVTRVAGTNQVRLTLTYLSDFGANFCTYTGATSAKTLDISLGGFTFSSVNPEYRISSFMAPSDASCDIAYARVPTARPSFPAASTWTKLGRLPLNIVLVLDKSPSMSWTIPGSTDIRWDRMTTSANLFTSVWDLIGAPPLPATVSSEGDPRDNLGLIFFSGVAEEEPLDPPNFFKVRGAGASPWGPTVSAILAGEGFGSATSIGAGLENARTRLNDVDTLLGDTAIVLLTDGEQIRPPCVIRSGETIIPTNVPYPGSTSTYQNQCSVSGAIGDAALLEISGDILAQDILPRGPIFTLGLGEGGMAASALLLEEISQETAGRAWFPINGLSLDTSFVDSLVQNLKGGTVSLMHRSEGTVPSQINAGDLMGVHIDSSITRAVFVLSWNGSGHQEVTLQFETPSNSNPRTVRASGENFIVLSVDLSESDVGPWGVRVARFNNQREPLEYQLSAYAVESKFSSWVSETEKLNTGQAIKIATEIGWGNEVLDGLPEGAVKAYVEKPAENLGNILQSTEYPRSVEIREDTSPLSIKIDQLARENELFKRVSPVAESAKEIALADVGNGRYEGEFNDVDIGGKYRIRVVFDWDDPRTGKIKRLQYSERQVSVLPTRNNSLLEGVVNPKTGLVAIKLNLKDAFGNVVGPGFEEKINVLVNGKPVEKSLTDPELKGLYSIESNAFSLNKDPNIKISFADNIIQEGALSTVTGGGSDCPWYDPRCGEVYIKIFILILIILLLLTLLLRLVRKS